jgi:FkbM family methyltransferase
MFGFQMYGKGHLDVSRSQSSEADVFIYNLRKSHALIDIGANVGLFTLLAAQEGHPVVAVEPHPFNASLLCKSVYLNAFSDVEVYPIALSGRVGVQPLFGGGQGASLQEGWGNIRSTYRTLTPSTTLDYLLSGRFQKRPLLIKLDAEGSEFDILQGAEATLCRNPKPTWIVENSITRNYGAKKNASFKDIFRLFWKHGYEALPIGSDNPVALTADTIDHWYQRGRSSSGGVNYLFRAA